MLSLILVVAALPANAAPTVTVSYPKTIMGQFTGRVFVFVSKDGNSEPRVGPVWHNRGLVFAVDVKQAKPDTDIEVDDAVASVSSSRLSSLLPGEYSVQAVIDRNPASPQVGDGDGNLCSEPVRVHVDSAGWSAKLICDRIIDEPTVHATATVKVVELESIPLSNAQRRSVVWRAVVVLPNEFATQPSRKFPLLVDIPDRGDSYVNYPSRGSNLAAYRGGKPFVYVRLDPVSATGYHYMVDSANNGPYAKALVGEFLPYIAKEYRGDLGHTLVTGTGAGGWSALWLQVTQPAAFSGCWAIGPDAVDFHAMHGLNLYTATNALHGDSGAPQPWSRGGEDTWQVHADFEKVLRGLRIAGWESDFSPKGKNNKPAPLFDRNTGQIDPAVAKAWLAYDLDAYLKSNWATVGPGLADRLHVFAAANDPDFRSDAVQLLQADLGQLAAREEVLLVQHPSSPSVADLGLDEQIARAEAASAYPVR